MTTLDLAIATHRPEGIQRVASMNLPHVEGVRYIVSWQNHENVNIPPELERDDVEIYRFDKVGLSNNRNNAIDHCRADIVLNSDDDLVFTAERLQGLMMIFERNPDVDVATFKTIMPTSPVYPTESCRLRDPLPKGYWVLAIAIAFRLKRVDGLRFHPLLGLGSPKLCGAEDELFLLSAIRRGLNCRFFPIEICSHPTESTGTKQSLTSGNLRASGCYIAIAYHRTWPAKIFIKALRLKRNRQSGFFRSLRYLFAGASYAPSVLGCDKCYRW